MLKIKDNVDLKELEKFGFKENKENDWLEVWTDDNFRLCVLLYNRHITIDCIGDDDIYWTNKLDLLFDLIQAGLVEKVGGESE